MYVMWIVDSTHASLMHPTLWHCDVHVQCCQHLLTRNPKKPAENPSKCIWLYGNRMAKKNPNILHLYIMLIRQILSSKILILGQNPSFWQH